MVSTDRLFAALYLFVYDQSLPYSLSMTDVLPASITLDNWIHLSGNPTRTKNNAFNTLRP